MIKYNEQYDSYYEDTTGEWVETLCSDPTCHYCRNRPEKPPRLEVASEAREKDSNE